MGDQGQVVVCPSGLRVRVRTDPDLSEMGPRGYLEFCKWTWNRCVTEVVDPGPYDRLGLWEDIGVMTMADWHCLFEVFVSLGVGQ